MSYAVDLMSNRERVLYDIARHDKANMREMFAAITRGAAHATDVERVGIWEVRKHRLVAGCVYTKSTDEHSYGEVLSLDACPAYRRALEEHRTISATDARSDPRTRELLDTYLQRYNIYAMLDVPVWKEGSRPACVLCLEHVGSRRRWTEQERGFATHLADLVALTVEAAERRTGEQRWEAVLAAVEEAVFVVDSTGSVQGANRSGQELLQLAGGGRTLTEREGLLGFCDASGRRLSGEHVTGVVINHALSGEVIELIFKLRGERRVYRVTSAPLTHTTGNESVVVLADITDDVHMDRLKGELLSNLAHELNTPLAIIKGYAQHLQQEEGIPLKWHRMLDAVVRGTDRMEKLTHDLVELSRITLGRITLSRRRVDLTDLVRREVDHKAPEVAARIAVSGESSMMASVDPEQMQHAIAALLDNALRFSPEGGDIDVTVAQENGDAEVTIRDHGVGIPPELHERIFQPFVRGHNDTAEGFGGLGVGLFLAREIVERHGGTLISEDAEGGGSRFILRLPREVPT